MRPAAHAVAAAAVALALALGAGAAAAAAPLPQLPRLNIEPGSITVSGLSSGGYMATQLELSHSALVRGAGIFAAGPWFCARGSMIRALAECLDRDTSEPGTPELVEAARRAAAAGSIDAPANLAAHRVFVLRGSHDDKLARPVADALAEFYRAFVPAANFRYVTDVPVAHGVPTPATGAACGTTTTPYLNACGYDGVGQMLAFLYDGPLVPPVQPGAGPQPFEQRRYDTAGSLAATGYLYLPAACARGAPCRLHVALHGCRQGADFVGEAFVRNAGYNGWAEANRIVVLYPQVDASWLSPINPQGCWDWWGYTGADYATRNGAQLRALRAMLQAIAGA
jgi:poly(3-hydroxybutyrate) depolymerase